MPTTLNLTIADDAKATRMIDAFCAVYSYPAQVQDRAWVDPKDGTQPPMIANPDTKKQFVQKGLKQHLREITRGYEMQAARAAAEAAADTLGVV